MSRWRLVSLLAFLLIGSTAYGSPKDGAGFSPRDDVAGDISAVLARALDEEKLALIVLGANWCHDSRALVARLDDPPLKALIQSRFVTMLVDVGYYQYGQSVMQRFGEQIYYATPTVLVVDPRTEAVIPHPDRHQWGAAASISMADSVNYFREFRAPKVAPVGIDPAISRSALEALAMVDQFEMAQAKRVATGYEVVGPLLAVLDQSKQKPANFDRLWRELAAFRNGLSSDIHAHRQALQRGEKPKYSLQSLNKKYDRLSWEP